MCRECVKRRCLIATIKILAVEVLAVTIFLSLLLAVFFVVLFLGSQRRSRHSLEQDTLLVTTRRGVFGIQGQQIITMGMVKLTFKQHPLRSQKSQDEHASSQALHGEPRTVPLCWEEQIELESQ